MKQHPPEALRAVTPLSQGLRRYQRLVALCIGLLLAPAWAHAQAVALAGVLGSKALLVVNASPPKAVGAGDEFQGVKVIAVAKDEAVAKEDAVAAKDADKPVAEKPTAESSAAG